MAYNTCDTMYSSHSNMHETHRLTLARAACIMEHPKYSDFRTCNCARGKSDLVLSQEQLWRQPHMPVDARSMF